MPIRHKLRGIPATPMRFQALYGLPVAFCLDDEDISGFLLELTTRNKSRSITVPAAAGPRRTSHPRKENPKRPCRSPRPSALLRGSSKCWQPERTSSSRFQCCTTRAACPTARSSTPGAAVEKILRRLRLQPVPDEEKGQDLPYPRWLAESDEFSYRLPAPLREMVNQWLDDEGVPASSQVPANRMR